MIKFLDLKKINKRFENQFQEKFKQFLDSGNYILGDEVNIFENAYASYCGTKFCVGVSNGLDALILIFKAYMELGLLNKKDEVFVPANTFIASILAIKEVGLTPVLIEPEKENFNISSKEIAKKITNKTKAILVVHLYGMLADIEKIREAVKDFNLLIIEDAAQAHGAMSNTGVKAGNLGDAAAFSFYPSKNLGALGDGGAITTNNEHLTTTIRKLRNYGSNLKYKFDIIGANCRLDEVQAAFLNIKLKKLDEDNCKRRQIAQYYITNIKNCKVKLPEYNCSNNHVFYAFVILVENRDKFIEFLNENNIQTLIHYPIPPHKQLAFLELNTLSLPITEEIHKNIISLPISPVMTSNEMKTVVSVVNSYN